MRRRNRFLKLVKLEQRIRRRLEERRRRARRRRLEGRDAREHRGGARARRQSGGEAERVVFFFRRFRLFFPLRACLDQPRDARSGEGRKRRNAALLRGGGDLG